MICYLSGDLVASTTSTWSTSKFEAAVEELQRDLQGTKGFEIVVSQGDSFQIECEISYGWAVALCCYFRMRMADDNGARVAFAVGEPDVTRDRGLGARSGIVYQLAGRGVEEMKEKGLTFRMFVDGADVERKAWVVASEYANAVLQSSTQRQCEIMYNALLERGGYKLKSLAASLGIAKSTISQHLRAAHADLHIRSILEFDREIKMERSAHD